MSWIDELKEGDKVFVRRHQIDRGGEVGTVIATTKTQIRVQVGGREVRFNKRSKKEIGGFSWIGAWSSEEEERVIDLRARSECYNRIRRAIEPLPLSALQAIEAILVEHGVLKEAQP